MNEEEGRKPLDPDTQEALSRRYAPEVVRLLRLASGRFAVFNHAGELCSIIGAEWIYCGTQWPPIGWFAAAKPPEPPAPPPIDLEDLGLT